MSKFKTEFEFNGQDTVLLAIAFIIILFAWRGDITALTQIINTLAEILKASK